MRTVGKFASSNNWGSAKSRNPGLKSAKWQRGLSGDYFADRKPQMIFHRELLCFAYTLSYTKHLSTLE